MDNLKFIKSVYKTNLTCSGIDTVDAQNFPTTYFTPLLPSSGSCIKIVNSQEARTTYNLKTVLQIVNSVFISSSEVLQEQLIILQEQLI